MHSSSSLGKSQSLYDGRNRSSYTDAATIDEDGEFDEYLEEY
jgi:hypothetical protein